MDKRIARVLPLLVAAACHKAAARQAPPPTAEVAEVMQI
jgi:hypothetical protein